MTSEPKEPSLGVSVRVYGIAHTMAQIYHRIILGREYTCVVKKRAFLLVAIHMLIGSKAFPRSPRAPRPGFLGRSVINPQ